MKPKTIKQMARKYGWACIGTNKNSYMVSFKKGIARINVYYSKMTVGTCIKHPKKGTTQLFRRHVSPGLLERIFANPRIHTGKGYYTKY